LNSLIVCVKSQIFIRVNPQNPRHLRSISPKPATRNPKLVNELANYELARLIPTTYSLQPTTSSPTKILNSHNFL